MWEEYGADDVKLPKVRGGYTFTATLGDGESCKVYRATAPGGAEVAVKVVSLAKIRLRNKRLTEQKARAAVNREVSLQRKMDHPNVVSLLDFYEIPDKKKFYLVLQLAGDSIEHFVPLPSWVSRSVFLQLLLGLEHIHSRGVVHRDIKPANLMVTEQQVVQISDFGEAQEVDSFTGATRGTAMFMAPELAHAGMEGTEDSLVPEQAPLVDIWAAGLTMYYAVTCQMPFNASSLDELFDKIARSEPPSANRKLAQCGPGFVHLLQEMLRINPDHRWSATESLRHPFVAEEPPNYAPNHTPPPPLPPHPLSTTAPVAAEESEVTLGSPLASPSYQMISNAVDAAEVIDSPEANPSPTSTHTHTWLPPPGSMPVSPSLVGDEPHTGRAAWPRKRMRRSRSSNHLNDGSYRSGDARDKGRGFLKRPSSYNCLRDMYHASLGEANPGFEVQGVFGSPDFETELDLQRVDSDFGAEAGGNRDVPTIDETKETPGIPSRRSSNSVRLEEGESGSPTNPTQRPKLAHRWSLPESGSPEALAPQPPDRRHSNPTASKEHVTGLQWGWGRDPLIRSDLSWREVRIELRPEVEHLRRSDPSPHGAAGQGSGQGISSSLLRDLERAKEVYETQRRDSSKACGLYMEL